MGRGTAGAGCWAAAGRVWLDAWFPARLRGAARGPWFSGGRPGGGAVLPVWGRTPGETGAGGGSPLPGVPLSPAAGEAGEAGREGEREGKKARWGLGRRGPCAWRWAARPGAGWRGGRPTGGADGGWGWWRAGSGEPGEPGCPRGFLGWGLRSGVGLPGPGPGAGPGALAWVSGLGAPGGSRPLGRVRRWVCRGRCALLRRRCSAVGGGCLGRGRGCCWGRALPPWGWWGWWDWLRPVGSGAAGSSGYLLMDRWGARLGGRCWRRRRCVLMWGRCEVTVRPGWPKFRSGVPRGRCSPYRGSASWVRQAWCSYRRGRPPPVGR